MGLIPHVVALKTRKPQSSVLNGNAPSYERWRARLNLCLDMRGSVARAAADYAEAHNLVGQERVIASRISRIRTGDFTAGGEWVCFLNEWMDGHCK